MEAAHGRAAASNHIGAGSGRVVAVFCFLTVVVPLLTPDLYPFTSMPMFSDAPKALSQFAVYLPDGTAAAPGRFGLYPSDLANPRPKLSAPLPLTFDQGELLGEEALARHLRPYFAKQTTLAWVRVEQQVLARDESTRGRSLGVVRRGAWQVVNPFCEG